MAGRPLVVTVGDPAGIGPEVSERALATWLSQHPGERVVVCGPGNVVRGLAARLPVPVETRLGPDFTAPMGAPSAASGRAALDALDAALALAQSDAAGA